MARRPSQAPTGKALTEELIERACYVGSPEHKAKRWWGGLPEARLAKDGTASRPKKQKTTICELVGESDRKQATKWIRAALKAGQCRFYEGDKDYPKHIWYHANGVVWFGYCINSIAGQYKGWPIDEEERRAFFD